ncbi:MAG: hypothetical protein NZ108_06805 [Bacteroidia bacterium]|nr:hypothetical protein [Bacteroidia bacterium]
MNLLRKYILVSFILALLPSFGATQSLDETPNPIRFRLFKDGIMFHGFSEFSQNRYHNFSLLPREYQFYGGAGIYTDCIVSGDDYSLGFMLEGKIGRNLLLEKVFAITIPIYLTARYGAGNQIFCEKKWGFGTAIGIEYYQDFRSGNGIRQKELRPSAILEVFYNRFSIPMYIRYAYFFTSTFITREGLQFGLILMI